MHQVARQAQDVIIGRKYHQRCDEHDADLEAELLRSFVHGLAAHCFQTVINQMAAIALQMAVAVDGS
jgi:hypothetical protein